MPPSRVNQPPVDTSHRHWAEAIMDPDTRETWTPEQKVEFITNIVNNETFITELTEVEEFITNVFNSTTYVNQIKDKPNGVPGLNGSGKVPKGRVESGFIDNPMTDTGDLIYGGLGEITDTVDILSGLSGSGGGGIVLSNSGGGTWPAGWTDDSPSSGETSGGAGLIWSSGAWVKADLGEERYVSRLRFTSDGWQNNGPDTDLVLESSYDNSEWTTRWQMSVDGPSWSSLNPGTGWSFAPGSGPGGSGGYRDTGLVTLDNPAPGRYWRFRGIGAGSGNPWVIGQVRLDVVEIAEGSEGAPTRLAKPTERRLLSFDPVTVAPEWISPAAANADTSGATLEQLEDEVNELKAVLRSFGIIEE